MKKTTLIAISAALFALFLIVTKEGEEPLPDKTLSSQSVILAFGDSLTFGYGVKPAFSYPSFLARKSGMKVINAGISGEESSEGLKRLPKLLKSKPDLVILCHGGNDILRKRSRDRLKANLLQMIHLIQASGASVLLVGVPDFGLLGFNTLPLYDDLAEETGVMYEEEVLGTIESQIALKSDRIHPNEKGYEMMADTFIEVLKENGLIVD